ncbi:hypothetical protein CUMW_039940 [Citrus unshiu]|nr:hypothetical protein CUMW_039940 [Citrus unshiu]
MDASSAKWLAELGMDEYNIIHQCHMESVADLFSSKQDITAALGGNLKQSLSYPVTRTPALAQDHIMAERKRREKLSQRFIALSAILPGLKKMDKASVLGDAIRYVKELQERVEVLEEQTKKRTVESVVYVKKSQLVVSGTDDESSSCDDNSEISTSDGTLPEIEARVSDKDVLIRIHCEKQKGLLPKLISQLEMLHLSITNTSVLPFGNSTLDITIIALKNAEFCTTMKDLVKDIRLAFLKFIPKASPSSSQIISFENSMTSSPAPTVAGSSFHGNINSSSSLISQGSYLDQFCSKKKVQEPRRVSSVIRDPSHAKDHVIAERKRREKLNQRFIALSALVPGLKKTDKASILGDSIKYLKQLQERVKALEEQTSKKTVESMIIVKKSQMIYTDDETSPTDINFDAQSNQYLPEIEVRVSDRDVLIRIHCEKNNNKGHLANILSEIENVHHLSVLSCNVLPFGNSTVDITVVAQMDVESDVTVKDLVKNLQPALRKFMMRAVS